MRADRTEHKSDPATPDGFEHPGIPGVSRTFCDLGAEQLIEHSIQRREGLLAANGALVVRTGQFTGRSPKDKFIVRDEITESAVNWGPVNQPISPQHFDRIYSKTLAFLRGSELFVQNCLTGADSGHSLSVRVITELAWHALFARQLLIRPERSAAESAGAGFTLLFVPGFQADPISDGTNSGTCIVLNFTRKIVLIAGTSYAGELKKSVFTILNHLLPAAGVLPMHCSANMGRDGKVALFFGLSGTGKTTLSADPSRSLIGDDEHGWSDRGVFNFEGGCYAKTIRLSREAEPEIHATTERFGTVLENVIIDPITRRPDFDDGSKTENTRAAYPLDFIANASLSGRAGMPKNVVMLTCDAFGVLPPIAKLTPAEAMYHFLSGYTAKVAGTEKGVKDPEATFSTCFGAPFMPRHPSVYGNMLRDLIAKHHVDCWLVNTGWTGGKYGEGRRMPIRVTRRLLAAALDGSLARADFRRDPYFGFAVPSSVPGVEPHILYPVKTWANKAEFDKTARRLIGMFRENFKRFEAHVDESVKAAAPAALIAA
jgi:phosphoenolpyruvate carboxykinase (ATP)